MFDRFTDHARKAMGFARQASQRLQHDYIGTEHVLVGLTHVDDCTAKRVWRRHGVDLAQLRHAVDELVTPGPRLVTMGQLPFTPGSKRVLEAAYAESCELGHNYIGTEHLLLGLRREGEGIAARVLEAFGLEMESLRASVLDVLADSDPRVVPTTVHLVGFDHGDFPREIAAQTVAALTAAECELTEARGASAVVAFVSPNDAQSIFEAGRAGGRAYRVFLLHLPGQRCAIEGTVPIEVDEHLPDRLMELLRADGADA